MQPRALKLVAIPALLTLLMACASARLENHTFGFDARSDSPDAEILDYRYGQSKQPGARPAEWQFKEDRVPQGNMITGGMLRPDELFVKWRLKSSGDVFQDTVDLRKRLPADIANRTIYFVVKGPQLYVYLISPERRPAHEAPIGPRMYHQLKVQTIYPDGAK
jgi:hypothetical protein